MNRAFRNKLIKSLAKAIDNWMETDHDFIGANSKDDNSDDTGYISTATPIKLAELCIIAIEISAENQEAIKS